jgi:hypothetical protein
MWSLCTYSSSPCIACSGFKHTVLKFSVSFSQSVEPFQFSKCILRVNFKASVETISCFYPFIGIVPGERFLKACKIKSAGCQYFHFMRRRFNNFFILPLKKSNIKYWLASMKLHTGTLPVPVLKIIVRDLKGAIWPRILLQKAVHYPENSFWKPAMTCNFWRILAFIYWGWTLDEIDQCQENWIFRLGGNFIEATKKNSFSIITTRVIKFVKKTPSVDVKKAKRRF